MAKYVIDSATLTAIGDAVRGQEGTAEDIPVSSLATRIAALQSGGGGSELVTVTLYLWGGTPTICYQSADGPTVVSSVPGEELTLEVVKDSILVIEYSGSTYYVIRGGSGYEELYDGNDWENHRYAIMLTFYESGSVTYEEV